MKYPLTEECIVNTASFRFCGKMAGLLECFQEKTGIEEINFSCWHRKYGFLQISKPFQSFFDAVSMETVVAFYNKYKMLQLSRFFDLFGEKDLVIMKEMPCVTDEEKRYQKWLQRFYHVKNEGLSFLEYNEDCLFGYRFASDHFQDEINAILSRSYECKVLIKHFKTEFHNILQDAENYIELDSFDFLSDQSISDKIMCRKRLEVSRIFGSLVAPAKCLQKNLTLNSLRGMSPLTEGEKRVLYWVAQGKSAKEVAKILGVVAKTVEKQLESVRYKLNCHKTTEAIVKAVHAGFISSENQMKGQ
jgi:DNA-binding CsgD family transcriptional regulator